MAARWINFSELKSQIPIRSVLERYGYLGKLTEKKAGMGDFNGVLERGISDEFQRLMNVTEVHQADDLDAIHPEFWPGRVTLTIGGEKVERYGKHMRGEMERPMSIEEVQAKFADLSPNHDDATRNAVFEVVNDLENRTVKDLVAPFKK